MMSLTKRENLMADKIKMGAGGVPYKVADKPKDEVISEVLIENPNKVKKEEKKEKKDEKL